MANLSKIKIPVKDPSSGEVTDQTFDLNGSVPSNVYRTDDTAETNLADGDYIPFYDTSATAKRKTLWSNIIAKIKSALGTAATKDYTTSVTSGSSDLVTSGAVNTEIQKCECLVLRTSSGVSALPYTFTDDRIETDMVCVRMYLDNSGAQKGKWVVDTDTAGKAVITGAMNSDCIHIPTGITLYLTKAR